MRRKYAQYQKEAEAPSLRNLTLSKSVKSGIFWLKIFKKIFVSLVI